MKIDIVNPDSGEIIGVHERSDVHRFGFWHHSVQANIVRLVDQKLEILIQQRSDCVDIAKGRFDQSLATQVRHNESDLSKVLIRGLKEELGINAKDCDFIEFNRGGKFRIKKTYDYDPSLKNNEILHLFIVRHYGNEIKPKSKKVALVKWIRWDNFVKLSRGNNFTKTIRMYTCNDKIRNSLEEAMLSFLKTGNTSTDSVFNVDLHSFNRDKFYFKYGESQKEIVDKMQNHAIY